MNESSALMVESLDAATVQLTLSRPDRRNALSIELMNAICEAFERLANEPQRRIVFIRGAGILFCSGLDLKEAADTSLAEESANCVARMFQTVRNSPLVTIAVAHGSAFAGGAGLLACCDFAIASEELKLGFPEVRRGLIAALVAVVLADRLRNHELNELFLLAEPITAERALAMGLLHRVVQVDRLQETAHSLAASILKGAPSAVRETKAWLREMRMTEPLQRVSAALDVHTRVRQSDEAAEGLKAFLERRDPDWSTS